MNLALLLLQQKFREIKIWIWLPQLNIFGFPPVDKIETCCTLVKNVGCDGSTKLSKWIAKNCEISCEKCGKNDHCKEPETCSDKSGKKCIAWAKNGYCKTIQGLAENCEKSCGKCKGNGSSDDHLGSSECTDESWKCISTKYVSALCMHPKVKASCKKSCGICGEEECTDDSDKCSKFVCYLPFFKKHCKKTCGKCEKN